MNLVALERRDMGSRVEDLLGLAQMLDEGKISQSEYDIVKAELIAAPSSEWEEPADAAQPDPTPEPGEDQPGEQPRGFGALAEDWLQVVRDLPALYRWAGAAAAVAILGVIVFTGGNPEPVRAGPRPEAAAPMTPEIPKGSLGIRLDDVDEAWNAVDQPPLMLSGVMVSPDQGRFDAFIHSFDGSAELSGVFDRSDRFVYGLRARAALGSTSIRNLYVHLCYMLHPGSQECLETFVEEAGVYGTAIEDFEGEDYEAGWSFAGNEWRLGIEDDVETIRVFGPGQS